MSDFASPTEVAGKWNALGSLLSAAVRLQKFYRGYRTRRRLADTAVVGQELWWRAIDSARLNLSTISFFNSSKPETATSRLNRIRLHASKVGKGLSIDAKAQILAIVHWIEAIDPRHRYGESLSFYYEEWGKTDSGQPFFYWLDIGDGKELDLEKCPRSKLRRQCIKYLGPKERQDYEYVVVEGKIIHKKTGVLLDTSKGPKGAKWIFVMSTLKKLYAGEKKKAMFHHSSFLAGGATLAAGGLEAEDGILRAIWASSGHYRPTDDRLDGFLSFLKENGVNLDEDQIHRANGDSGRFETPLQNPGNSETPEVEGLEEPRETLFSESLEPLQTETKKNYERTLSGGLKIPKADVPSDKVLERINSKEAANSYQLGHQLSRKWSTGNGPRIGCVADYPPELREQALEFVNLSPRTPQTPSSLRQIAAPRSPLSDSTSDLINGDGNSGD